jgi:hypothetical protein
VLRRLQPYYPAIVLFGIFLCVAIATVGGYGISWDEPIQRELGLLNYEYIFNSNKQLLTNQDRGMGMAFELPLIFIEKWLGLTDTRDIYIARHLFTHLFFLLSIVCGYVLVLKIFRSRWLATLAFLMLALQPRIYAHSFFNSKDVPFLSVFLIAMLCLYVAFSKKKVLPFMLLGFVAGYATAIRIIGVVWLAPVAILLLADVVSKRQTLMQILKNGGAFIVMFLLSIYVCWPVLWGNPISNFIECYTLLSNLKAGGPILFDGIAYPGDKLPAGYMPLWFCITMPEVWLLTGVAGLFIAMVAPFRKRADGFMNRQLLAYVFLFVVPPAVLIATGAAIIDDWRHLYFIYPAFVMLGVYAVYRAQQGRMARYINILLAAQVLYAGVVCISIYPYQQVYFNFIEPRKEEFFRRHFDYDYWGCAYADALKYLLAHDNRPYFRIYGESQLVDNAILMLPAEQRKRFIHVWKTDDPDYFITNYRGTSDDPPYPLYHAIQRQNNSLLGIYRMK